MTITDAISVLAHSLKERPSCLAAIIVAGIFATYIYLFMTAERIETHQRVMSLIDRCTIQMK